MPTWIEDFMQGVNSVDLSTNLGSFKKIEKGEAVLATLTEYQQKLYRFWENRKSIVEHYRDRIDDLSEAHTVEHKLGIQTKESCEVYLVRLKDTFDQFKAVFTPYLTARHIFQQELEQDFTLEMTQYPVIGVRDGKTLIGRENNSRNDDDTLIIFYVEAQLQLRNKEDH